MKKLFLVLFSSLGLFVLAQAQGFEDLGSFKTPSDNIHCVAYRDTRTNTASLDCQMQVITAKIPVQPKDCDLDYGYRFGMDERGRAERSCYGDTIYDPKHKTLAYGKIWKEGGFTCEVSTIRLRCSNLDKRGFELSKAVQKFF